MGFLDQTTLSSLSSVTIVFSILFSTLLLKEPFNRWVLLQLVLMLTGASLMLVFSNKVEREFTLDVRNVDEIGHALPLQATHCNCFSHRLHLHVRRPHSLRFDVSL